MFSLSQEFHAARRQKGRAPIVLFVLNNALGTRVYSDRYPTGEIVGLASAAVADGSLLADGSASAGQGSMTLLDQGARVLSFGRLRETLTPFRGELLASLEQEEVGSVSLVLSNAGAAGQRPFSRMEALENLLGAEGELRLGFSRLRGRQYLTRFKGRVIAYRLESERLTLTLRAR